jgi:hypothetical protein
MKLPRTVVVTDKSTIHLRESTQEIVDTIEGPATFVGFRLHYDGSIVYIKVAKIDHFTEETPARVKRGTAS